SWLMKSLREVMAVLAFLRTTSRWDAIVASEDVRPIKSAGIPGSSPLVARLPLLVESVDAFLPVLGAHRAVVGLDLEGVARGAVELGGLVECLLGLPHRDRRVLGDAARHRQHLLHQLVVRASRVDHAPLV